MSVQENVLACGQGYFFLVVGVLLLAFAFAFVVLLGEIGVLGSTLTEAEGGAWDIDGMELFVVAEEGVGC